MHCNKSEPAQKATTRESPRAQQQRPRTATNTQANFQKRERKGKEEEE